MKQVIRLNERELHRLVSESVKRIMNEEWGGEHDLDNANPWLSRAGRVYNGRHGYGVRTFGSNPSDPDSCGEYYWPNTEENMDNAGTMDESNRRAVKRTIRESMNELSPEFLAHAANVADAKGRSRQSGIFHSGAKDAWNRDYGFENVPGADGVGGSSDDTYSNSISGVMPGRYRHDFFRNGSWIHCDNAPDIANDKLKAAQRKKFVNGNKSIDNMKNNKRPDGTDW